MSICLNKPFSSHKPTLNVASLNSLVANPISKSKTTVPRVSFGQNDKRLPLLVTPDRNSKFSALQPIPLAMPYGALAATNANSGAFPPSTNGFLKLARSPRVISEINSLRKHWPECKPTNSSQSSSLSLSGFFDLVLNSPNQRPKALALVSATLIFVFWTYSFWARIAIARQSETIATPNM